MINVAVLGTGAISDSHIRAYLKLTERCRIVALADLEVAKAGAKAAQYGLAVPVFRDVTELFGGPEFALASVCLPPFAHAPAALELLRAGRHVLVEKPLATSLAECDGLLAAAQAAGRLLSVVAQNRFKTPVWRLKRVLAAGLIGRVLQAQVDSFWWRGPNYYDLWWRGTWEKEGGGCTMNHAVHHLDLFQWLRGMPTEVQAVLANLSHANSEVEDFAAATLRYADGGIGQITASLVHHGEAQQLAFQGERASVAVPWQVQAARARANGFPEANAVLVKEIQSFYDAQPPLTDEGHEGQIANVLAAVEGREPLLVDGRQGRQTLELISAIYQAGHQRGPVKLPLTPADPFYTRAGIRQHARRFHQKTRNVAAFAHNEITLGRDYGA